jgi:hypothetical protein
MIDITRRLKRHEAALRREQTRTGTGCPRRADMWHGSSLVTVGNAITRQHESTQDYGVHCYQNAAADGDTFTNGCFLAAGVYTFVVLGSSDNNRGKIDWTLDGVSIVTGQDWYSAASVVNVVKSTSSVAVLYSGWHQVKGVVNGKNGSSSGYNMLLTKMWFTPAAD